AELMEARGGDTVEEMWERDFEFALDLLVPSRTRCRRAPQRAAVTGSCRTRFACRGPAPGPMCRSAGECPRVVIVRAARGRSPLNPPCLAPL
ncbi:hypothetical protein AB0P20_25180, partial [Streptomyces nigra]